METLILVFAIAGLATQLVIVVLALFEPPLAYEIAEFPGVPLGSKEFARVLAVVSDAHLHNDSAVEVLTNGTVFYEAELTAIRSARSHICLEAYIFRKGNVAATFLSALTERARNGVEVRLVLDAVGSFNTPRGLFAKLIAAGGRVCWYMPFRWYNLSRFNNRTHREMLIVDGTVAFVGGAGVADHWYKGGSRDKAWRDTMVCVRGSAIASLQSIFAENWLESSGELLTA